MTNVYLFLILEPKILKEGVISEFLQGLSGGWRYRSGVDYLACMPKPFIIWYPPHKNNSQNKQKQPFLSQQNNQLSKENSSIYNDKTEQTHPQEFTKAP